jgi:hypothetical protein
MARTTLPTGNNLVAKLITLAVLIALAVLVVRYPGESAQWISGAFDWVGRQIDGLVTFFRKVSA